MVNEIYNGSRIKGDAVMLYKYGGVYNGIDNLYHPNPGSREEEYPEIERCIDWLYMYNFLSIINVLDEWIKIRVANELFDDNIEFNEIIVNIMYSDDYTPCNNTINAIKKAIEYFNKNPDKLNSYIEKDEIEVSSEIAEFINEKFLRIRSGGKLNPEGSNSIYFRISSHGYDWHRDIVDFLWNTFKDPKKMPKYIWIGHDSETNPPEITLFSGTPNELFENFDDKVFENIHRRKNTNYERECFYLNKEFRKCFNNKKYISYK